MSNEFIEAYMLLKENCALISQGDCKSLEVWLIHGESLAIVDRINEYIKVVNSEDDPEEFESILNDCGFSSKGLF